MKTFSLPDNLPVWNYFKIVETDDLRYLLRLEDYADLPDKFNEKDLAKIYESIVYAMPPNSFDISYLQEKLTLAIYEFKAATKVHPKYDTLVQVQAKKVERIQLEKEQAAKEPFSLDQEIITIESVLGVTIDPMKCSIKKYMAYRELATTKANTQNKKHNENF